MFLRSNNSVKNAHSFMRNGKGDDICVYGNIENCILLRLINNLKLDCYVEGCVSLFG